MYLLETSYIKNEERICNHFLFECSDLVSIPFSSNFYYGNLYSYQKEFLQKISENILEDISRPGFRVLVKNLEVKKIT